MGNADGFDNAMPNQVKPTIVINNMKPKAISVGDGKRLSRGVFVIACEIEFMAFQKLEARIESASSSNDMPA